MSTEWLNNVVSGNWECITAQSVVETGDRTDEVDQSSKQITGGKKQIYFITMFKFENVRLNDMLLI